MHRGVIIFFLLCFAGTAAAADVEFKVVAFKSIEAGIDGIKNGAPPPVLLFVKSAVEADKISDAIAGAYPGSRGTFRKALDEYREMDFGVYNYAVIFTRPIDNYAVNVKSVTRNKADNLTTIRFSYSWERRQYLRAPDLRIYFAVICLPKSVDAVVADYGTGRLPMLLKPAKIDAILPKTAEQEKEFSVSAAGVISLNEEVERPGEGPFLYVLRSEGDLKKLDAKMKSGFRKADKSMANIMDVEAGIDFGKHIYLVILSAPCASAVINVRDAGYDSDTALTLVKVDYTKIPAERGRRANLAYAVVALPRRDAEIILLVKSEGGERRVLASGLKRALTTEEKREEYDIRLESANFAIADTLAMLGEWCVRNRLYEEGRRHLGRALKFNPMNVRAARTLRELSTLEKLEKKPETAEEYAQRALVYKGLGRFSECVKDIEEALKLDEKCAQAHFAGGVYQLLMRNFDEALKGLNRAVELDPSQARYFAARAQCRAMTGDLKAAEKDAAIALSLEENCPRALGARAIILLARASLQNDREKARPLLEQAKDLLARAVEISPDSEEYYSYRALAFLKLADYARKKEYLDSAFRDCIKSLQLNPYQYDSHLQLASYYIFEQNPLRAESSLSRAVSGFPDLAYVHERRGLFYLAMGDNEAALKDFDRCVELAPDAADGYFNRARAKTAQSKLVDARRNFDKAIELKPEDPRYYWERGLFHYNTSNLESALEDFKKANEIGVPNASAFYMIGLVKFHMKDYQAAVKNFRKCLEMNPDKNMRDEVLKKMEEAKEKEAGSRK